MEPQPESFPAPPRLCKDEDEITDTPAGDRGVQTVEVDTESGIVEVDPERRIVEVRHGEELLSEKERADAVRDLGYEVE